MGWSKRDIDEGRRLVTGQSQFQWQLGDLAKRVFPVNLDGLEDFAQEIGVAPDRLRRYRTVATTFPVGVRRTDLSWAVHDELQSHKNATELLHERSWTVKNARSHLGKAAAGDRGSNRAASAKAEIVKQALADPEVAAIVGRDEASAKAVARASAKITDPVRDKGEGARKSAVEDRMRKQMHGVGMVIVTHGLSDVLDAVVDANKNDRPITNVQTVIDTVARIVEELKVNAFKHDANATFPEVLA